MGYIYKITNDVNQKIYIGQTKRTIEQRWKEHQKYSQEQNSKSKLYIAMREIGIEHFQIKPIEEIFGVSERNDRERYWIKYYDSFENGYNSTRGGGCFDSSIMCKNELYDTIVELRLEGKSYDQICDILKCSKLTISSALKEANLLGQDCRSTGKTEQILELLEQGVYLVNIAKELKCDFKVVQRILAQHPEFNQIYHNLYNSLDKDIYLLKDTTSMTNAEIAKVVGCSERTIYRALKRR